MKRTVVVHQPDFMPYLGFFHRFLHADLYIALDHVQFAHRTTYAWTHRDKIKTRNGAKWLSVSVRKSPMNTPIKDVEFAENGSWREANLNALKENYRGAPFFDPVFQAVERAYREPYRRLIDLNFILMDLICEWLNIRIPRLRSSELSPATGKSEMIVELVAAVQGTHYLSGVGARAYHDQSQFDRAGIQVVWQEFEHPVYPQQYGEFIPYLSTIDALFNCGPEQTARMLRGC